VSQTKVPLPDSLMKAIRATVNSPDLSAPEKFEAVVLVVHGYGLFAANTGSIDPRAYAIPEAQWTELGELMQSLGDGPIAKVNMSLEWMNIGPSGYKPETEEAL
jgi:hypothetical protein